MTSPPTHKPSRWGWFPTVLYLCFVAGLLSLARIATQSPPALVETDYYEQGLRHDQMMAAEQNAKELGIAPEFAQTENGLSITMANIPEEPALLLQRPSDASADSSITLEFDANTATLPALQPGLWRYTFTCTQNDKPCAVRGRLHIQ
jgi:hypothetical protein